MTDIEEKIIVNYKSANNKYSLKRAEIDIGGDGKNARVKIIYTDGTEKVFDIDDSKMVTRLAEIKNKKSQNSSFTRIMKQFLEGNVKEMHIEKDIYKNEFQVGNKEILLVAERLGEYYKLDHMDPQGERFNISKKKNSITISTPKDFFDIIYDFEDVVLEHRRKKTSFADEVFCMISNVDLTTGVGAITFQWVGDNGVDPDVIERFMSINE